MWAVKSEEIVIIAVTPKMCDVHNEREPRTWSFRCDYERDIYEINQPVTHRPEYLAVRDPDTCYVELLFRIDRVKSVFEKGKVVPQGKPKKSPFLSE